VKWSPKQEKALINVKRWLDNKGGPQVYRVFGFAGVGKTTLAKHFAEGVEGMVLAAAYTGKSAHVLHQKGFPGATTIHSLIYHSRDKSRARLKELEADLGELRHELISEGYTPEQVSSHQRVIDLTLLVSQENNNAARPFFTLNTDSAVRDAALVIIDECTMVDEPMGLNLLSFGTKVLVLGDPAQLGPIRGAGYFTENVTPDIMLDEIHRQAADNPIIAMATKVRLGENLDYGNYGSSRVIRMNELTADIALGAEQIIVGCNATRYAYNSRLRELHGRTIKLPEPGDRLVCLRNNHDLGILNGALYNTDELLVDDDDKVALRISPEEGGNPLDVEAHSHYFYGKGADLQWWERKAAEEFDYGYALTGHKSQGSQWDSTLVVDESYCFRNERNRWLYTVVTRAVEQVIVAK